VGAQSAALLASGAPLGDPPSPFRPALVVQLEAPGGYRLDDVARSHGGVGLVPTAYDGQVLSTVLPDGAAVRVLSDLSVELSRPTDVAVLRRVLDLDADLSGLWSVAPQWRGRGWQLRASCPFEALVQALAATNTAYRSTQAMMRELVGSGPFPTPAAVLAQDLRTWGYRAASLRALAEQVDDVDWDDLDDDALQARALALKGFGPFAAASVLPLMGRPRPLVLDGWLAAQVPDPQRFTAYGRWGGTVLWLEVSARWTRGPSGP
jgi:hypothetical protein